MRGHLLRFSSLRNIRKCGIGVPGLAFPTEGQSICKDGAQDDDDETGTAAGNAPISLPAPAPKFRAGLPNLLEHALVGRSHRSGEGKARLKLAIELTREVLEVPDDYLIGIVPASDTGAVEMALWSLLGERGVDMLAWESFGEGWVADVVKQLKLKDVRKLIAPYGELPDLGVGRISTMTWSSPGTARRPACALPMPSWIPADRKGLTICDATSAAFAQNLDFAKLDVVTFSWQKVLGGEGAHGVLILSPARRRAA